MNSEKSPCEIAVGNMGKRSHVIYIGGIPVSVRTSDFGLPMNGKPLQPHELYFMNSIMYMRTAYEMRRSENDMHIPDIDAIVPRSVLDYVHDYTHGSHCLQEGRTTIIRRVDRAS